MSKMYLLRHVKTGLYYTGLTTPQWTADPKKAYSPGGLAVAKGCTPLFGAPGPGTEDNRIGPLEVVEFDVMTTFFEKGVAE